MCTLVPLDELSLRSFYLQVLLHARLGPGTAVHGTHIASQGAWGSGPRQLEFGLWWWYWDCGADGNGGYPSYDVRQVVALEYLKFVMSAATEVEIHHGVRYVLSSQN